MQASFGLSKSDIDNHSSQRECDCVTKGYPFVVEAIVGIHVRRAQCGGANPCKKSSVWKTDHQKCGNAFSHWYHTAATSLNGKTYQFFARDICI